MRAKILCIFLVVFVFGAISRADPIPPPADEDIRAITIDGKDFVAFDRLSALFILDLRIKYPKLLLQLKDQDTLIKLKDTRIILLEKNIVNMSDQKDVLFEQVKGLTQELDNRSAWYKSPYLWFSVGVVLGITTTVLVVYGVS